MGLKFYDNLGGTCIYNCKNCDVYLSNKHEILSNNFTGVTGQAYLFKNVMNIRVGKCDKRDLRSGVHFVRDVYCLNCDMKIGWMYEFATVNKERYKEGAITLELALIDKVESFEEEPRKVNKVTDDITANSPDFYNFGDEEPEEDLEGVEEPLVENNRPLLPPLPRGGYENYHNVRELEDLIAANHGFPNLAHPIFRNRPAVQPNDDDHRLLTAQNAPGVAAEGPRHRVPEVPGMINYDFNLLMQNPFYNNFQQIRERPARTRPLQELLAAGRADPSRRRHRVRQIELPYQVNLETLTQEQREQHQQQHFMDLFPRRLAETNRREETDGAARLRRRFNPLDPDDEIIMRNAPDFTLNDYLRGADRRRGSRSSEEEEDDQEW